MINSLSIQNFFGIDNKEISFSPWITNIYGDHNTGKTLFIKLAYSLYKTIHNYRKRPAKDLFIYSIEKDLRDIFKYRCLRDLVTTSDSLLEAKATFKHGLHGNFNLNFTNKSIKKFDTNISNYVFEEETDPIVYIPYNEIVSIYPGLQAAIQKRELFIDKTYSDLASSLNAAPLKKLDSGYIPYISKIENLIGGTLVKNSNQFYLKTNNGDLLSTMQCSTRYNFINQFIYLIKNGEISKSSTVIMDLNYVDLSSEIDVYFLDLLKYVSKETQLIIVTNNPLKERCEDTLLLDNKEHIKYINFSKQ